jgi:hypothetical protein
MKKEKIMRKKTIASLFIGVMSLLITLPALAAEPANGSVFADGSYTIVYYVEFDPLYQFEKTGSSILLRSDPNIGEWGEDYYGYWADPYTLDGNSLTYRISLTVTTYDFSPRGDDSVDIMKTVVVHPYSSNGEPTTTVTTVGNAVWTGEAPEPCPDLDGDGVADAQCGGLDCNDSDASVYPGAPEICRDGIDQNCSGSDASCDCFTRRNRWRACR